MSIFFKKTLIITQSCLLLILGAWGCGEGLQLGIGQDCEAGQALVNVAGADTCVDQSPAAPVETGETPLPPPTPDPEAEADPTPSTEPKVACQASSDCALGERCNDQGDCEADPEAVVCEETSDCALGRTCQKADPEDESGFCLGWTFTLPTCEVSADCAGALYCVEGLCTTRVCNFDVSCNKNEDICIDGICQLP